jgi:phage host-nuclease inhibitor protein Gam
MSNAEKVRRYRERKQSLKLETTLKEADEASPENAAKIKRIGDLIAEARLLAAEVNSSILASLKAKELTIENVQRIMEYEGKETTVKVAYVGLA